MATIDYNGYLCTNTLRIGLLKVEEYSLEFILGILNSRVVNYLFLKLFLNKDIYAYQLERIPIPLNSNKKCSLEIEKHVVLIIKFNEELTAEQNQDKIQQLKQRITYSEDKINQLVYELYNLTEKEIKIIEGEADE